MRNKEVVATGTLLNNGQQVLFLKYLRSYLTLTQRRSQTYRSARRLCGNMEPRSLALITPPSGDSFQTGNLLSFQNLSLCPLNIVLIVCASCIAIFHFYCQQDHPGRPDPCLPHCGRHHASLTGERELFQESNNFNSVKNLSLRKWERGRTHIFVSNICRDSGEGGKTIL